MRTRVEEKEGLAQYLELGNSSTNNSYSDQADRQLRVQQMHEVRIVLPFLRINIFK